MANLKKYIQEQIKAGYDINTIRHYLQEYGYSVAEIEKSIKSIYKPPKPTVPPLKIVIPVISVLLVMIITITYIALQPPEIQKPTKLLDLELDKVTDIGSIGDLFEFRVSLFNFGTQGRFDVFLEHRLLDDQDRVLETVKETLAVETRTSKVTEISIPANLVPGDYRLKTVARYEGLLATAQFEFPVELFKECPESCDDADPCTDDICSKRTNFECYYINIPDCVEIPKEEVIEEEPVIEPAPEPLPDIEEGIPEEEFVELPSRPDRRKNEAEIIDEIKRRAKEDPERAKTDCSTLLTKQTDKDFCFETIASEVEDIDICNLIIEIEKKDRCISSYALNTFDFSVCAQISNADLKQSCAELGSL